MGARDGKAAGRGDVLLAEILRRNRHIGTVIAVENQRKGVSIFNTQEYQRREPLFICGQMAGITANLMKLFTQKTPHMLVAHPCQH